MIGIAGVLQNPSTSLNHHNGGWTDLVLRQIEHSGKFPVVITEKDDWDLFEEIWFLHGVNYKFGTYNLFGGVDEKLITRLRKIIDFEGTKVSLFKSFPNISELCTKRAIDIIGHDTFDHESIPVKLNMLGSKKMTIGDSHSISVCPDDHQCRRLDGKTLHGLLNLRIENLIAEDTQELIIYCGNIDIRFHLANQPNWKEAIRRLMADLYLQLSSLDQLKKITLVHALPIENESRKIPGTGLYKGKPFYGDWALRNDMRVYFNKAIDVVAKKLKAHVLTWPGDIYMNSDHELPFEVMESRQSVHLRPKFYHTKQDDGSAEFHYQF